MSDRWVFQSVGCQANTRDYSKLIRLLSTIKDHLFARVRLYFQIRPAVFVPEVLIEFVRLSAAQFDEFEVEIDTVAALEIVREFVYTQRLQTISRQLQAGSAERDFLALRVIPCRIRVERFDHFTFLIRDLYTLRHALQHLGKDLLGTFEK